MLQEALQIDHVVKGISKSLSIAFEMRGRNGGPLFSALIFSYNTGPVSSVFIMYLVMFSVLNVNFLIGLAFCRRELDYFSAPQRTMRIQKCQASAMSPSLVCDFSHLGILSDP